MISFEIKSRNQLLLNPKMADEEKSLMFELKADFEKEFGLENYILVTSSGSSKKANQSPKLIALKITRVLNSANRVNHYLKADHTDTWGLVLPEFHVAGIGVRARAYLTQSKVVKLDWNIVDFASRLEAADVKLLSLVPTQVFDLVQASAKAPKSLKTVFVGGGPLNENLRARALELGWPVVETYGMTETASMIAVRSVVTEPFELLDNVYVKIEKPGLAVHCDSLLTAALQKRDGKTRLRYYDDNSWFQSDDQAEIIRTEEKTFLKFLGRSSDYIKILGEGVSLLELRDLLSRIIQVKNLPPQSFELLAFEDARKGHQLFLVVEDKIEVSLRSTVFDEFNKSCRPYERLTQFIDVENIPRTDLGKLNSEQLKSIIKDRLGG